MSVRLKLVCAFALGVAGGVFAGCQTYDFEPVQPLAVAQTTQSKTVHSKNLKPNLMLLVDKSGSMLYASDPTNPNCPAGCGTVGNPCPGNCPTRWSELLSAMNSFLTTSGEVARMGFVPYPTTRPAPDIGCSAPTLGDIDSTGVPLTQTNDVPDELNATASAINGKLSAIAPTGGTPTGSALTMLGAYPPLSDPDRDDFILLLTDGLPNCNSSNANSCENSTACRCTLVTCGTTLASSTCRLGCLDKDASVQAAATLKSAGIRTIVVGFGADTAAGDGPEVLQAMAEAGGFPRACPNGTDAECAPGTCNVATKVCSTKFYQARSGAELAAALRAISDLIVVGDPCEFTLDAVPSDPKFLTVLIDGASAPSGPDTWTYNPPSKVTFTGALCQRILDATPANKVNIEFRIVEGL